MWKVSMIQVRHFILKMSVLQPKDDQVAGRHHTMGIGQDEVESDGRYQLLLAKDSFAKDPQTSEYWKMLASDFQYLHRSMVTAWKITALPLYAVMAACLLTATGNVIIGLHLTLRWLRTVTILYASFSIALCIAILEPMARTTQLFQSGSSKSVRFVAAQYVGQIPDETLPRYIAFMQTVQCTDSGVILLMMGVVSYEKLARATVALCTFVPTLLTISSKMASSDPSVTSLGNATNTSLSMFAI